MEKYYLVNENIKNEINSLNKTLTNEFPRVILRFNRRTDGYSLTISGTDDDVTRFINRLSENGVVF